VVVVLATRSWVAIAVVEERRRDAVRGGDEVIAGRDGLVIRLVGVVHRAAVEEKADGPLIRRGDLL
jgi:hypothetical protein